eukprot:TRINITY_DN3197_c0_g1_i1.p1 TRINITY_DN3197_c0_g1~~TRINITY_DN3197_c0_g1_i1.p1  ORF type:complete len:496 (-),score=93.52 TRINITY_DN3197_c0_g1_i1:125-1612(-)
MTSLQIPLSPSFHPLDVGLDLEGMGLASVGTNDVDLFKYFLNEDEIEAASSEVSSPGSYDSSSPGVESPLETTVSSDFDSTPSPNASPVHHAIPVNVGIPISALHRAPTTPVVNIQPKGPYIPVAIKQEPIEDVHDKKRKIKQETPELHDDAIHYLTNNGSMIPEEDRHMKRQRRLIKNRESAQLSRLRKKMYIDDLEKKVSALTQDNDALTKRVATLVQENKNLSDQVSYLQNALKQSQANPTNRKLPIVPANNNANNNSKNMKAAGVCMLMILFSFGLFFNIKPGDRFKEPTFHVGRVLTAIEEESKPLSLPDQESSSAAEQTTSIVSRKRSAEDNLPVVRRSQDRQGSPKRKIIKAERKMKIDTEDGNEAGLVPLNQAPAKVSTSSGVHHHPQELRHIIRQPDTQYIYCSEPQNLFDATQHRARDADDGTDDQYESNRQVNRQPLISLLVPANSTFPSIGVEHENSLMEITCKILSINLYPSLVPLSNDTMN